jgi:hypothetical protein
MDRNGLLGVILRRWCVVAWIVTFVAAAFCDRISRTR